MTASYTNTSWPVTLDEFRSSHSSGKSCGRSEWLALESSVSRHPQEEILGDRFGLMARYDERELSRRQRASLSG
jgi:hypothetical protein